MTFIISISFAQMVRVNAAVNFIVNKKKTNRTVISGNLHYYKIYSNLFRVGIALSCISHYLHVQKKNCDYKLNNPQIMGEGFEIVFLQVLFPSAWTVNLHSNKACSTPNTTQYYLNYKLKPKSFQYV